MDLYYANAKTIATLLQHHGFKAYFCGGFVRDMILNRPSHDIDIVTDATPDQIIELFPTTITMGIEHGVVIVRHNNSNIDVATLRKDGNYSDGRRPDSVIFTDNIYEDAMRRDFTINALYYDPSSLEVFDPTGFGVDDLKIKQITAVGNACDRFNEDKLRMLRAARFATTLHFSLHHNLIRAIRELAHEITCVSWERIREELIKIIDNDNAYHGLHLLKDTHLLEYILPEVYALIGREQKKEWHPEGDAFEHTAHVVQNAPSELSLAALLHDVGKVCGTKDHDKNGLNIAETALRRLKFDNVTIDNTLYYVRNHMIAHRFLDMRESKQKRHAADKRFFNLLLLAEADDMTGRDKIEEIIERVFELNKTEIAPERIFTGHNLIGLGFKPGPIYSEILNAVYDEQLEGNITTLEQAIDFVERHWTCTVLAP